MSWGQTGSRPISTSLSICLYISLSLSISPFLCLSTSLYISIYLSLYLSLYLHFSVSLPLSISPFICLSTSLYISIYLSLYLSLYLHFSVSLPLSISPFICLSTSLYISISLSLYLSLYLHLSISLSVSHSPASRCHSLSLRPSFSLFFSLIQNAHGQLARFVKQMKENSLSHSPATNSLRQISLDFSESFAMSLSIFCLYMGRCGSGGKSCRLAVGGLPVRSQPGRVEVSLSETPNPRLLLTSGLVACMAANRRWCVNG